VSSKRISFAICYKRNNTLLYAGSFLKAMDRKIGHLINFNVLRLKEGIKRLIL